MGDLLDPASELPDRPPQFLLGVGVIIAGIRAANGDAIPAQTIDCAAKVRSANLKSGLQFTAGDDSQLTAVIRCLAIRLSVDMKTPFRDSYPERAQKKQGPSVPFG